MSTAAYNLAVVLDILDENGIQITDVEADWDQETWNDGVAEASITVAIPVFSEGVSLT